MGSLGLMFVGSVLFINGLSLLGVVSAKAAAPINAFIGVLLVGVVLSVVLRALDGTPADVETVLGASGFLLFAFTYLYVAIGNWTDTEPSGLGWYCGWAVPVSLLLAGVSFFRSGDAKFGAIWLSWALLFAAFFLVLARSQAWLTGPTGYLTVLEAFTTTTIPGALLLLGLWQATPTALVVGAQIVVLVVFLALAAAARRRTPAPEHDIAPDRAAAPASSALV